MDNTKSTNFRTRIEKGPVLVGMIHIAALPGTPGASLSPSAIVEKAAEEAQIYKSAGLSTVMVENMHDIPYTKAVGPEVTSVMALAGKAVKSLGLYCGVQVLAGCNREAMAVAHAADLDFIRAEGYVFGHVGDEGYIDSCAGDLLRYRRAIGASPEISVTSSQNGENRGSENEEYSNKGVMVFADIKKKHSAHSITSDVSIRETALAAKFFLADGVIVTGVSTGEEAEVEDLKALQGIDMLKAVGSGVTPDNFNRYRGLADLYIVGSYLKYDGNWMNSPDPARVEKMLKAIRQ